MKPDAELREDVIPELARDPQVTDPDAIAVVKDGAVTLTGRPADPDPDPAIIEQAFERQAEVATRNIRVEVSDHTVGLHGHVRSLQEATAAEAAAAVAPGVDRVDSHLVVP
jgi:osmotically-inducible protein OsmY